MAGPRGAADSVAMFEVCRHARAESASLETMLAVSSGAVHAAFLRCVRARPRLRAQCMAWAGQVGVARVVQQRRDVGRRKNQQPRRVLWGQAGGRAPGHHGAVVRRFFQLVLILFNSPRPTRRGQSSPGLVQASSGGRRLTSVIPARPFHNSACSRTIHKNTWSGTHTARSRRTWARKSNAGRGLHTLSSCTSRRRSG